MSGHWSIVVSDRAVLSDLFGANDQNIKIFEELLGVRILTRGNEIFLETDNDKTRRVFKTILKSIEQNDMVFGIGPAGTGKTFLAVAEALKAVIGRSIKKLVITRPVIEAGESLGFLPGDLETKINPYLKPLYDAMEMLLPFETIKKMEENGSIDIAPLAYMRGRTLSDSFIILDEAQNTTRKQMKMFLTRIGEKSKTVITGDITQIDLPNPKSSGLLHAMSILSKIREIKFIYFNEADVVRNKLVRKIVHAYETDREK